jgi:pimeloyl-ACP methyl ester carboxylesterase
MATPPTERPTRRRWEVRLEKVERAGHWPWLDRPEVIDTVAEFLASSARVVG